MTRRPAVLLATLLIGCAAAPARLVTAPETAPGFRVRADINAPLNADLGWAGALGERVAMPVDQPFRVRFEVEATAAAGAEQGFALEYRRNGGAWTPVEAHDFPYPQREIEIEFSTAELAGPPQGWQVVSGDAAGFRVAVRGDSPVLRAAAGDAPLLARYPPPWPLPAFSFAAEVRLGDGAGLALVYDLDEAGAYTEAFFDASNDRVRISRIEGGTVRQLHEQALALPAGQWLELEIQLEAGALEVKRTTADDEEQAFSVPMPAANPTAPLGLRIPSGAAVDIRSLAIEGEPRSPLLSIVATAAYQDGEPTRDLLQRAASAFRPGVGLNLSEQTPAWPGEGAHGEFEWPLVIRRFADGAQTSGNGDRYELRMVDRRDGMALAPVAEITAVVPPRHLGGTFVETPGRIGPWQAANGDLYFIMEPTESDNLFMMVKSSDGGESWHEVDGANRPRTGDLESVDARQVGGTLHIVHQVTEATRYHAFRTSDHAEAPDTWAVTDELATTVTAHSQMATLVARPDGSLVTFHLGDTLGYSIRSPEGVWSEEIVIDENGPMRVGPQAVLGAGGTVHLAYRRADGRIGYRRLLADGRLTPEQTLAAGAGRSEETFGAVLPLVYLPESDSVVIVYRLDNGQLWSRRVDGQGRAAAAVPVTARKVITNAVDSQQAAADVVADGNTLHLLLIDAGDRSLYHTQTDDQGNWTEARRVLGGIKGSWVRGGILTRADGRRVYGYVIDTGSEGGAGMNRYGEIELGAL